MIKKVIATLLFTLPTLFDVLTMLLTFLPTVIDNFSINDIFTIQYFLTGYFGTILFFLFVALYNLISRKKPKTKLAKAITTAVSQNQFIFICSCVMPLSSILTITVLQLFPHIVFYSDDASFFPLIFISIKLGFVIILSSAVAFFPQKYLSIAKLITAGLLILLVLALCILYQMFTHESEPDFYNTFSLDDKKAVYILNYDGDYWVTYYHVSHPCTQSKAGKICTEVYEKLGNAPITKSPVELKPFIDKHVTITGEFVKTQGLLEGNFKRLCIKGSCGVSPGPGQWVSSPITITSIKISKKL